MTLESATERRLRLGVEKLGGMCCKLAPIDAGIPDRLVLLPGGRVTLVELKQAHTTLRPIQRVWHTRARKLGTEPVVLHGDAEVDAWLAAQGLPPSPSVRSGADLSDLL